MIATVELPLIESEDKSSALANCIRNNYRHIRKWAKRTCTNCFRLYDREIHHYPLAIDYYAGRFLIHYFAKGRTAEEVPLELVNEVHKVLDHLFGVSPKLIFWRTRAKHKESRQYEKRGFSKDFFTVMEYGVHFKVNLKDYLDTGLFLDHRETRHLVASFAKDKKLLNLFAYTCAFSVHAALAGASFTKSVDLSNTYLDWAEDNFLLNGSTPEKNEIVRDDCLKFLDQEVRHKTKYDLIVIDPPRISRSKKMDQLFDIQVDYVTLIAKSLKLLRPGGTIFFSTNAQKFTFNQALFPNCTIEEITEKTLPIDFKDSKIHRCWKIKKPLQIVP